MKAQGMIVLVNTLTGDLGMPFYQSLVTDGSISRGEFDGTRSHLAAIVAALRKVPPDKIEAMFAQHYDRLTEDMEKYNAVRGMDILGGFRHAQILAGRITTIMAKSGLQE